MKKIVLLAFATVLMMVSCTNRQKTPQFKENPDMEYRTLGSTGLRVGVIGLGCGGFDEIDSTASRELVTYALDHGMNYMDLYDANPKVRSNIGYGLGDRRAEMIIQGHIGCWWNGDSYERTRDVEKCKIGFEDLLERLHTDYIDVGMIHIVDKMEEWQEIQGSPYLQYVQDLKAQGKIKHIGLSSHNAEVALAIAKSGLVEVIMFSLNPAFDRVQSDKNPWDSKTFDEMLPGIDPVRVELYDYCAQHDIAITVMKTFGGGDRLLDAEKSPLKIALTRDQCFAYVLAKPCVKVALCSIDSASKVDEYLHYLKATDEEKDYNSALSKQTAQNDMDKGACTYCNHCMPCSACIPIAKVNELLDKAEKEGLTAELQAKYDSLPHHAGECTHCGACLSRCPFGVDIPTQMDRAKEVFGK
ncbi:MAG: aldo/keto reductase [Bacteroidales bacterium]|nr:aldo/keto reductase [Bacteroidales bacterium]